MTRRAAGGYVAGVYTPGAPTTSTVQLSIQPITGRTIHAVPEGRHASDVRVIYSTAALLNGDVITIGGEPFEIYRCQAHDIISAHYVSYAARVVTP